MPLWALGLCGLLAAMPASAEMKIGVVNFQKLMEDAPQVKSAMQALQNEFGQRQRELVTMQNDLKSRQEKREFSRKGGEFQDDLSTRKNEEIGKVQRYLVQEVQTYSSAQGYDLVLVESLYTKPSLDITAQILDILKTKPATLPATSAPKAPPLLSREGSC